MSDTKKIIMLVVGLVLAVGMIVVAIVVPSAEKNKVATRQEMAELVADQETGLPVAKPVTYAMLTDMPAGYNFYEDYIVQTAAAHYVAMLTDRYQKKQNKQTAEYMSIREAFSYAGVSDAVYWEIMQYNGEAIEKNKSIKRVLEKPVPYNKNKSYMMITSKEDKTDMFYIGEEKNRRPDGVGAVFKEVEGNLALLYAGSFKDGSKNGNGITFASYGPIMYIERIATYKDGRENGKAYEFSIVEQENMIHMYKAIEEMIDSYKDPNQLFACIQSSFKTSDMEAIMLKWLVRQPGTLYLDLPVFKCSLAYEGRMKHGEKVGRCSIYDMFGSLAFKGSVKKASGANLKEDEYPILAKNEYYDRYIAFGEAVDDSFFGSKGLTPEEVQALWDEYASRDTTPDSISGNTAHYIDLPQVQLGEENERPQTPTYDQNITINPYINRIPYVPAERPSYTPEIPSEPEIPNEPEETIDNGETSVIHIDE